MTGDELYARALLRGHYLSISFRPGSLKRWLNGLVARGWLNLVDGRYYLTAEGFEVAAQLDGSSEGDPPFLDLWSQRAWR